MARDGQPFFPFGLIINGEVTSQTRTISDKSGSRLYHLSVVRCMMAILKYMAYLAVAQKYGLYVIDAPPIQPCGLSQLDAKNGGMKI